MDTNNSNELPIGRIASEQIEKLQELLAKAQDDVQTYKGAIEGIKLLVGKIQEYVENPIKEVM